MLPFCNANTFAGTGPNGVKPCAIHARRHGIGQRTQWYRALGALWCAALAFVRHRGFRLKFVPKMSAFGPFSDISSPGTPESGVMFLSQLAPQYL